MSKLLNQLLDDARVYNKEFGHDISLHIDTDYDLYGAELYLTSALSNLVVNAIKYTPKGGNIVIRWQAGLEGCTFSVTDNGIGIAAHHISRLTERFYRVDSGRSRATGGTGLGLAIVKHVLYQHQARLDIESIEGHGSIFHILFAPESVCPPAHGLDKALSSRATDESAPADGQEKSE